MTDTKQDELHKLRVKIWNDIRDALTSSAMSFTTIPKAKEFQIRASENIGGHVRRLVDTEVTAVLDRLIKQQWNFGENREGKNNDAVAVPTRYITAEKKRYS